MKGCSARQISGVNFGRGKIHALLSLFASMTIRFALPRCFADFFGSGFWAVDGFTGQSPQP